MSREGNVGKLVAYSVLLLMSFFGLLQIIFSVTGGRFLYAEIIFTLLLLIASAIGLVMYRQGRGQALLFFVFLALLLNVAVFWLIEASLFITLLFLALVGFLLSLPRWKRRKKQEQPEEPHSVVFEPVQEKTKTFSPGKYVASARGNTFHAPKCEWAKKIAEERRVWFREREEAIQKGYTAHGCVQ